MLLLFIALGLVALAAFVWLLVVAFQTHILWGLACLFLPFATLIFGILHWNRAAKPFVAHLASSVLIGAVAWSLIGGLIQSVGMAATPEQAAEIQALQQDLVLRMQRGELTQQQAEQELRQRLQGILSREPYHYPVLTGSTQASGGAVAHPSGVDMDPAALDAKIADAVAREDALREQPRAVQSPPPPKPVQTYIAKDPRGARADIGKMVSLKIRGGQERSGGLIDVSAKGELLVERRLHGGTAVYTVDPALVAEYKVLEWVRR